MNVTQIQQIACVGSGVIGTSWALCFARCGYQVSIYDVGQPQLDAAQNAMQQNLRFLVNHQVISEDECTRIQECITYTANLAEAVGQAQYIQESGPESYPIKERILSQLEAIVSPEAVIATSTSGLLITKMAEKMDYPGRLVGGHPYNPPHLIPLVEIVKGEKTSDETVQCAYDFYTALGKTPVILNKEVPGFISNRLQVALYREAIDLVINGVCSLEDVDKACLYGPGLRWGIMGPNLIFHLGAGTGGLGTMLERQRESTNMRLADIADWKEMPQVFVDMASAAMEEAISRRSAEEGRTMEELIEYRDTMLLELLRLHKKL